MRERNYNDWMNDMAGDAVSVGEPYPPGVSRSERGQCLAQQPERSLLGGSHRLTRRRETGVLCAAACARRNQ